jgi:hypothetical protein
LLTKGEILCSQKADQIELSFDQMKGFEDDFEYLRSLNGRGAKINGADAYDYLRGTVLSKPAKS